MGGPAGTRCTVLVFNDRVAFSTRPLCAYGCCHVRLQFISLRRLWRGRQQADGPPAPVLNLGFLVDSVMHTKTPLDWDGVLHSNIPLKVAEA